MLYREDQTLLKYRMLYSCQVPSKKIATCCTSAISCGSPESCHCSHLLSSKRIFCFGVDVSYVVMVGTQQIHLVTSLIALIFGSFRGPRQCYLFLKILGTSASSLTECREGFSALCSLLLLCLYPYLLAGKKNVTWLNYFHISKASDSISMSHLNIERGYFIQNKCIF